MADQSWYDTLKGAAHTIVPSSIDAIKNMARGVIQAGAHPVQTEESVGKVLDGIGSKAYYAMGLNHVLPRNDTQEERYKTEKAADDAWNNIAKSYSTIDPKTGQRHLDMATFKNTLATNPAQILTDAATVLPAVGEAGLVGRVGKLVGAAGDTAEAAGATGPALAAARAAQNGMGTAGKIISKAGDVANPIYAPLALAKRIASGASKIPVAYQGAITGVPINALKTAFAAGKAGSAPLAGSETAGQIFKRFASGNGTTDEIQAAAARALNAKRKEVSDAYTQGKAGLANAPVDLQPAFDALNSSEHELHRGSSMGYEDAKKAISGDMSDPNKPIVGARQLIEDVATNPDPGALSIDNVDALKRQIWDLKNSAGNAVAKQHLGGVYNGIKDAITATDPEYANLMDQYQIDTGNIQDLTKSLGLGQKTANSVALGKQMRAAGKPAGSDLLSQLAEKEPGLPYMLAGQAARESLPGHFGKIENLASGLAAAYSGQPLAMGAAAVNALASSPKVSLGTNYALGKIAGSASPLGALGGGAGGAELGTALAGQLSREEDNKEVPIEDTGETPKIYTGNDVPAPTDDAPDDGEQSLNSIFGSQDAPVDDATPLPRATGGAVSDIEHLVHRLMTRAQKEKKASGKETEAFLSLPDHTVAKALAISNRAMS